MPKYTLEDLRAAKKSLSDRYLKPQAVPARFAVLAASTAPTTNVVGVGVGRKITAGKQTRTNCVRFYVEHKLSKTSLSRSSLLPEKIDGVPTDVIVTGRFLPLITATAQANRERRRPARPGCSIGFEFPPPEDQFVMAGTFGAVVEKGGRRFILSNNHVLAENGRISIDAPIFQPGLLDGGDTATDQIAELSEFVPVTRQNNAVDCALARVLDPGDVSPRPMPRVNRLLSPQPIAARDGMLVEKTGRTTGYTRGSVTDVAADVSVGRYSDSQGEFDAVFTDQIIVESPGGMFSDRGDSGSIIVERQTKRVTALLFAGSASHTIGNPIGEVLARLGVQLVVG